MRDESGNGGEMNRTGIVRRVGWTKNEHDNDVFQAIIEFPEGPPDELTFSVVWGQTPVTIAVVHKSATPVYDAEKGIVTK